MVYIKGVECKVCGKYSFIKLDECIGCQQLYCPEHMYRHPKCPQGK